MNQTHPNPFKVTAFSNAIEAIAQIGETIKSGDDLVLEVCHVFTSWSIFHSGLTLVVEERYWARH